MTNSVHGLFLDSRSTTQMYTTLKNKLM